MLMTGNEHRLKYSRYGARSSHCSRHLSALKEQPLTTLQIGRHDTQSHVGIPVDRDRSFRFIVTGDSGLS